MKCFLVSILAVAAILSGAGEASAQVYPSRPLTMIVPFPAGGATDTLARYLGEHMRDSLGQPIVIENVGGAAGSIGVTRAVRAPLAVVEDGGIPQVAESLGISEETAKTHLRHIFEKTGQRRQADLVKLLAEHAHSML